MIDELKQWEYDRGYEKGKTDMLDVLDKIRAEIEKPLREEIFFDTDNAKAQAIALNWCIDIIDKYRTGSNETQTNEIVYDVGGHMYGAMGGDVIMDILAGKGKE